MVSTAGAGPRIDETIVARLIAHRPDLKKVINTLHDLCDFFSRSARSPFSVPAPTRLNAEGATSSQIYRSQLQFFHRVLILRSASLLPAAVTSLNDSHPLSLAFAVRALHETAAFAAYHASRLVLPAGSTIAPEDYGGRLRNAVMGSRFDWLNFFKDHGARLAIIDEYDESKDWKEQWPANPAANILTMFEALARRLKPMVRKARGIVFVDYSLLSDLCHPAAGSHLLFVREVEPNMRANLEPEHSTVLALAEMLIPCAWYSAESIVQVLAELETMDERLSNAKPRDDR